MKEEVVKKVNKEDQEEEEEEIIDLKINIIDIISCIFI